MNALLFAALAVAALAGVQLITTLVLDAVVYRQQHRIAPSRLVFEGVMDAYRLRVTYPSLGIFLLLAVVVLVLLLLSVFI